MRVKVPTATCVSVVYLSAQPESTKGRKQNAVTLYKRQHDDHVPTLRNGREGLKQSQTTWVDEESLRHEDEKSKGQERRIWHASPYRVVGVHLA